MFTVKRGSTDGYYRIINLFYDQKHGKESALDCCNNANQPYMADIGNFSGQYWQLTPINDGYFRLTNMNTGEGRALDCCDERNTPFMANEGNFTGQFWLLTPIRPVE